MKLVRRILPFVVIVVAALLLLYVPDIGPERYTDLATFFRVEMKRQSYAGYAVAAVEKGSVLYVDAFGVDGNGKPLTVDSPLFVGGLSKSFAGMAALSLARERKLDLERPVREYLPWFGFAAGGADGSIVGAGGDVTLRHLLSHTSGVSDASFDDAHELAPDLEAAARSLAAARPVAPPGRAFHYLNTDYQVLGLVMQKATGKEYPEIVGQRVFGPLGMKRTSARPEGLGVAVPVGNGSFFGAALPRGVPLYPFAAPSSSVVSTASDLGLYLAFLAAPERQKRSPLPPSAVRSLYAPLVPGIGYGYGWYIQGEGQAAVVSHDGSVDGFSSRVELWPASRGGVAIVAAQNSILQSLVAMPALVDGARRIMADGSADRPFPLGRLYILLAVVAAVHVTSLALQTGGAIGWAKAVKDRAEATGAVGPMLAAAFLSWAGIALRVGIAVFAPRLLSLGFGRIVTWKTAFLLEPGLAAWCASACFFGILRNSARLAWLRGAHAFRRLR
mgnify:CR=1 FL=1